jgi:2,3,4,5-tetrahydropyridine-2-carboxylate N-succinyltransferase
VRAGADPDALREAVEQLAALEEPPRDETVEVVAALLDALEAGAIRAARPTPQGWEVNVWVKRGILLGFRIGANREVAVDPVFHFRDRDTFPTRNPAAGGRDVRVVPGGTTIRRGAFVGEGVVVMPPAYVNVGAWVGEASMVDSHALVGSCAQLGARVHLSAAAQIGGVLEPIGALPVIVEDDVFVGGGCGIYEGTRVCAGAVIGAGVVLTRSLPVFDLERGEVLRAPGDGPLVVPENAVVVPGSRPARGAFAERHGLHLHAPVIVKYRDPSTDGASALEETLR